MQRTCGAASPMRLTDSGLLDTLLPGRMTLRDGDDHRVLRKQLGAFVAAE